ncbi:MAG TPA: LPS export ABC transporter periplasmic protein LptC [Ferruginibacter sp.]|nr:LPS export ABC transporter periplasmic protein LptC [Ferruginibacter sp.]
MTVKHRNTSLFAALLTGCIFLFGCENNETVVNNLNKKKIGVEEAKKVNLNYTIGGNTKAILTAPIMLNVADTVPYVEFPQTLHADFYNENGIVESKLDARYGKYKQNKSIVFLKDSVKVINLLKGDTLYCDELYWDRNRTGVEFYTDKPVRIRTKTQVLNGIGMESSQDFRNWHIIQSTGTIQVPSSKFPG